jgi:two-component system, NtrC family, nitrogen regulation response regulator GlnG
VAHDQTTQELSAEIEEGGRRQVLGLTLIAHPDVSRIGDRVRLVDGGTVQVSRIEPVFSPPRGERQGSPIEDVFVSRLPLVIREDGRGAVLEARAGAVVIAGGEPLDGARRVSATELDDGITLELGPRVALLLHRISTATSRAPQFDLVGESDFAAREK